MRPRWPAARPTRKTRQARAARARTGLRVDQAAAALAVLTDGRRVSVINASAGSGKTWVLAAAGQAWAAAGPGRVIGITPSQSARNTLAAGVPVSYNTAQFLGHLPGQRGARGPIRLRPGDLILMDEASMAATPDLADVISQAAAAHAKVILAGDTQQLQAVENGGGMSLPSPPRTPLTLPPRGPVPDPPPPSDLTIAQRGPPHHPDPALNVAWLVYPRAVTSRSSVRAHAQQRQADPGWSARGYARPAGGHDIAGGSAFRARLTVVDQPCLFMRRYRYQQCPHLPLRHEC